MVLVVAYLRVSSVGQAPPPHTCGDICAGPEGGTRGGIPSTFALSLDPTGGWVQQAPCQQGGAAEGEDPWSGTKGSCWHGASKPGLREVPCRPKPTWAGPMSSRLAAARSTDTAWRRSSRRSWRLARTSLQPGKFVAERGWAGAWRGLWVQPKVPPRPSLEARPGPVGPGPGPGT